MRYYLIGIEDDADANRLEGIQGPLRIGPAWEDQYRGPRIKSLVPVSFGEATALYEARSARGPLFPPAPSAEPAEERQRTLRYPPQPWSPDEILRFTKGWRDAFPVGDHREPGIGDAPSDAHLFGTVPKTSRNQAAWTGPRPSLLPGNDQPSYGRCDARARKGTGEGVCDGRLDEHGQCPLAGGHL